jgi:inward rectifier potassium channel
VKTRTQRPGAPRSHRNRTPAAPLQPQPPAGVERPVGRMVPRRTDDRMVVIGAKSPWFGDLYHRTLTMPWWVFLLALSAVYLGANVLFALLYLGQRGAVANARPGEFWDALFFSVQTMATIGYGQMAPATFYANLVVTFETVFGLMLLAVATGLVFARFSRPTARVVFSRVAVVAPYDGVPTLSLRLANERRNQILEARVGVTLVRDERSKEGTAMRRFYDLPLARARSPIFSMTFTVMHQIDRASPLCGATPESLAECGCEIVVTVTGLDETMSQTVHARTSYLAHEILFGHRFADVIGWTEDGRRAIDYRRFHDTVPLQEE